MRPTDDQATLEARLAELRKDLADATRHAAALADAEREQARLQKELADVEARIKRAHARTLPLLSNVRVAAPCPASWDAMTGDDRVRFCGQCEKNVYNLSAMESAEAEALLARHGASLCVRFYQRADGTVMTTDCPVGVRRRRVKRVLAVAGAGAMAAAGVLALRGRAAPVPYERPVMGAVARMPEPPGQLAPAMGGTAGPHMAPPPKDDEPALMGKPVERHHPTMGMVRKRP